MAKSTEMSLMCFKLTREGKDRNWDFVVIFINGKQPMFVPASVKIEWDNYILTIVSEMGHPYPQNDDDANKTFICKTYVKESEIAACDFYKEQLIQTVPKDILVVGK